MAIVAGTHAEVTLHNVEIVIVSDDQSWVLVRMPAGLDGTRAEVWLPADPARVSIVPSVPASWPPLEGDIWRVNGGVTAWVVSDQVGALYFVTFANVRNQTRPITTDAALVRFGLALSLAYRPTP